LLKEHRERLTLALVECACLEQYESGETARSELLDGLHVTLRDAIADCDQLAAWLQSDERHASGRDIVRATFGDYTVEIKAPGMTRPLASWIEWFHGARRVADSLINPFGE
jgi:hypothetical protein